MKPIALAAFILACLLAVWAGKSHAQPPDKPVAKYTQIKPKPKSPNAPKMYLCKGNVNSTQYSLSAECLGMMSGSAFMEYDEKGDLVYRPGMEPRARP